MSKNKNNKPIWGTRIKKNASTLFKKVGGSLPVDKRLFKEDIEGSVAHVEMLHKQKIINFRIKNKIIWGLKRIKNEIVKKKFNFNYDLEDIHMNIENRLFELIGDDAGYIHTARSRNDQVVTDFRLWIRKAIEEIEAELSKLQVSVLKKAEKKDYLIFRIIERLGRKSEGEVYLEGEITEYDLIEWNRIGEKIKVEEKIKLQFKPFEIKTFLLKRN